MTAVEKMSNSNRYSSIHDYLGDFQELVERELPEELPGSVAMARLVMEYVGADKRTVLLYVQISPTQALRIRYKMPVPAGGARLFDGEGLMAHTAPTFGTVAIADIEANAAAAAGTMRPWNAEVERIAAVRNAEASVATVRRKAKNILIYWDLMRPLLRIAIRGAGVRTSSNVTSSSSSSSSSAHPNHPLVPAASTPRSSSHSSRATTVAVGASTNSNRTLPVGRSSSRSSRGRTPDPSNRRSSSWRRRKTARRKTSSDPR